MRYPDFLKQGDTIGFAAPSFGCAAEPYRTAFDNALTKFKDMGYQVLLGPNAYKGDGIGISTDPESCGAELEDMYCGRLGDCSAIFACGGGELMCETMEHVDLAQIAAADPKWYVGYSDNTNFLFNQAVSCDTAGLYAPCAPAFGMEPWHKNLHDVFDIITGRSAKVSGYGKWEKESLKSEDVPLIPYNCTEDTVLSYYPDTQDEIRMHGRLLGGCLDVLVQLCGTEFDKVRSFCDRYADDGVIWFLEACDLNVFGMRRAMWQLEHAGWFDTARGFIFGRPYHYDEPMMGLDRHAAVTEIAGRHNVPVIMDADIGHIPPMMPLVMGSLADVRAKGNAIDIDMKFV